MECRSWKESGFIWYSSFIVQGKKQKSEEGVTCPNLWDSWGHRKDSSQLPSFELESPCFTFLPLSAHYPIGFSNT